MQASCTSSVFVKCELLYGRGEQHLQGDYFQRRRQLLHSSGRLVIGSMQVHIYASWDILSLLTGGLLVLIKNSDFFKIIWRRGVQLSAVSDEQIKDQALPSDLSDLFAWRSGKAAQEAEKGDLGYKKATRSGSSLIAKSASIGQLPSGRKISKHEEDAKESEKEAIGKTHRRNHTTIKAKRMPAAKKKNNKSIINPLQTRRVDYQNKLGALSRIIKLKRVALTVY